ncbi:MAG: hypothetical protein WBN31_06330 [Gammaproteobacteria bacterium]
MSALSSILDDVNKNDSMVISGPQLQVCVPELTYRIYSFEGRNVLAIPPEFASAYAGSTLDINAADLLIF